MSSINGIPDFLSGVYASQNQLLPSTGAGQETPPELQRHPPERVPQVHNADEAERLLNGRTRNQQQQRQEEEELPLQGRRALQAYQALTEGDQREYISGLLGIDTFA